MDKQAFKVRYMKDKITEIYSKYSVFRSSPQGYSFFIKVNRGGVVSTIATVFTNRLDKVEAIEYIYNRACKCDGPIEYDPISYGGCHIT